KAYQLLENDVRHLCSIPFTEMKSAEQYQSAIESFQALSKEVQSARTATDDKASAAALNRLGLTLDYVQRDLAFQKAKVENVDAKQLQTMRDELNQFLLEHAQEGVFVVNRNAATKQAARSGTPKN